MHDTKRNKTSFSFDSAGRSQCFSCGAKGSGAVDLLMKIKRVDFRDAVETLRRPCAHAAAMTPII